MRDPAVFREEPRLTHVDVEGHDGHVLEVERGVDLVHEVERRGFEVVQREDQRQRAERLLPARQVEDLLPALLRRPHAAETGRVKTAPLPNRTSW